MTDTVSRTPPEVRLATQAEVERSAALSRAELLQETAKLHAEMAAERRWMIGIMVIGFLALAGLILRIGA